MYIWIGGGVSAGVGLVVERGSSLTEPASSGTTTSMSIVGSANLGPLGASKEVPVKENGQAVIGRPGSNSMSATKEMPTPRVVEGLKLN